MGLVRKVERIRYLRSIYLWSWEISGVLNQIVFISVLIEKRQLPFIFRRPFYIRTYMYRYLHLEHTHMHIVILFSPESVCCCCLMSRLAQQALRWCKSDPVQSRPREWAPFGLQHLQWRTLAAAVWQSLLPQLLLILFSTKSLVSLHIGTRTSINEFLLNIYFLSCVCVCECVWI